MSWIRNALLAVGVLVLTTAGAQAQTLFIRASVWNAAGTTLIASSVVSSSAASPLVASIGTLGDFTGIAASLTATPFTGPPAGVSLAESASFANTVSGSTQRLVVEFANTGISSPTGTASVSQSGSTSATGGYGAGGTSLSTGVQAALGGLPALTTQGTGALPAGFLATATSTGAFIPPGAQTLQPNPANGSASLVSPYGAYSVFLMGTTNANGTGSAAATVTVFTTPVTPPGIPEPATLISACVGLVSLGAYKLRRRQTVA
jgi:hypothetical protein